MSNQKAFLEKCSRIPLDLELYYRHVLETPDGWPMDILGEFPADGIGMVYICNGRCIFYYKIHTYLPTFLALIKTKIPSGHRSITDRQVQSNTVPANLLYII